LATGGIVNKPTTALIGEGGMNEAVVPLPNGKAIPVDMRGATGAGNITSNVTVNVSTDGETSSSDPTGAAKLGKAIDTAVRKVILDERRSGGLLYSGR
jgi:phage-related minor tail protein